jgi:hypothetical protein
VSSDPLTLFLHEDILIPDLDRRSLHVGRSDRGSDGVIVGLFERILKKVRNKERFPIIQEKDIDNIIVEGELSSEYRWMFRGGVRTQLAKKLIACSSMARNR